MIEIIEITDQEAMKSFLPTNTILIVVVKEDLSEKDFQLLQQVKLRDARYCVVAEGRNLCKQLFSEKIICRDTLEAASSAVYYNGMEKHLDLSF